MSSKNGCIKVSGIFAACIIAMFLVVAGFIALQQLCMNNDDAAFVSGYCFRDNYTRTLVAAIFTVAIFILNVAVSKAIDAYRTAKLTNGINEGVYIAMSAYSIQYKLKSLKKKKWAPVIAVIMLFSYAPGSLQTFGNLGIDVKTVYVKNKSTATIFTARSYYNATALPQANNNIENYLNAVYNMRLYGGSSNSISDGKNVKTIIIRNGYTRVATIVDGDDSNSFKRNETIGTVSTSCTRSFVENTTVKTFITPVTTSYNSSFNNNIGTIVLYDITYTVVSPNVVTFNSTLLIGQCTSSCLSITEKSIISGLYTVCNSNLTMSEDEIIYTVGSANITTVNIISKNTTVNVDTIGSLVSSYTSSVTGAPSNIQDPNFISGALGLYIEFPNGLFNDSLSNIVHSQICSATSHSLSFLRNLYGTENLDPSTITSEELITAGNNSLQSTDFVFLYNTILQTYVSNVTTAIISGVLIGLTVLVCLAGMYYAVVSVINIKDATESAIICNVDNDFIVNKRHTPSNDPSEQRNKTFDDNNDIYCRVNAYTDMRGQIVKRISITNNSHVGEIPNKKEHYS